MNIRKSYRVVKDILIILAGICIVSVILASLDAFEWVNHYSRDHESYELDEIVTTILVSPFFILWFAVRRWRDAHREANARYLVEREHELTKSIVGHDILTGLPNRLLFTDRLSQAMALSKRRGHLITVAYIDLDDFKGINDTYGHEIGDRFLIIIAQRLRDCIREEDTIARLGGDEFIVLLNEKNAEVSVTETYLGRLLHAASNAVDIDGKILHSSASIGATHYTKDNQVDADHLIRQADQAMYQAKLLGKNRSMEFDSTSDQNTRRLHESIAEIKSGLENSQFVLLYQPKVNMCTGEVVGLEALIRWHHPERGTLTPDHFLPVIENHVLAIELGEWVVAEALRQASAWKHDGLDISISINLCAIQIQQADFDMRLDSLLQQQSDVSPDRLTIEITETSVLDDITHISERLKNCCRKGVKFSIDDFGTGYSSLTYLKRLPATELKMDKSFIRDMLVDSDDLSIIEGVLALSDIFEIDFVAEGIESKEHGEKLLELGCELAQGYVIAKPMTATVVPGWIKEWNGNPVWSPGIAVADSRWVQLSARQP